MDNDRWIMYHNRFTIWKFQSSMPGVRSDSNTVFFLKSSKRIDFNLESLKTSLDSDKWGNNIPLIFQQNVLDME